MKALLCFVVTTQLFSSVCFSQPESDPYKNAANPAKPPPPPASRGLQVFSFEEEVISLPIMEAFDLMKNHSDDMARYNAALLLVASGKAKLERMVIARCKSGQRTAVDSIVEFRYPVEYSNRTGDKDAGDPAKGKSAITPVSFETRNIGDSIELQMTLGADNETIDLEIVTAKTQFVSDRKFAENIEQPIFNLQKSTGTVSLKVGKPFLLGSLNPPYNDGYGPEKEQRVWLDFITFREVTEAEAEKPSAEVKPAESRFIMVGGEVKSPRRVPYADKIGLFEAIQAAGGFTDFANRKKVIWISEGKRAVVDATIIMKDPSQEVILKPGDQIQVPTSIF